MPVDPPPPSLSPSWRLATPLEPVSAGVAVAGPVLGTDEPPPDSLPAPVVWSGAVARAGRCPLTAGAGALTPVVAVGRAGVLATAGLGEGARPAGRRSDRCAPPRKGRRGLCDALGASALITDGGSEVSPIGWLKSRLAPQVTAAVTAIPHSAATVQSAATRFTSAA